MSELKNETSTPIVNSSPIKFTEGAIKELKLLSNEKSITDTHGLRVGVKGGGCSGFSYILGFDVQKEKDQIFELEGMKVFLEKAHGIYLIGMEIDWHEGLNNRGFIFNNPNATDTCGCGTSFNA